MRSRWCRTLELREHEPLRALPVARRVLAVTVEAAQALVLASGGLGILALTVALTRTGALGLRYGLGWLAVSLLVLVMAGLGSSGVVAAVARQFRLTPTGFILLTVAGFLLLLCLQVSVSLSRLERTNRVLLRETALLAARFDELTRPGACGQDVQTRGD